MRTAVMLHPPRFGATAAKVDDSAARAIKGVHAVLRFDEGVAVVADNFWTAQRGRDALVVEWDESQALSLDSEAQRAQYRKLAASAGHSLRNDGDETAVLAGANQLVEAVYELPDLAHAAMEPTQSVDAADRARHERGAGRRRSGEGGGFLLACWRRRCRP